ncbi:MAG: TonB-dependent receptor [Gammaproteobacteria bacterium]|nr:TonB-dependent receptor [Gammaproteobacteria bacterium]
MTIRKSSLAEAVSAAIFASVITLPAIAAPGDDVIIVTATKSNESIQDVPLAITALSGEFMDEVNLTDVKDLISYTPGITGNSPDSFIDAVSVRGIRTQDFGIGGDPSTAFFKNDLYEGRNGSAVSTLYDMDRAEILRGPQGFLFGRNSIAGAVSVHTRKAEIDYSSGNIELDIAQDGRYAVTGAANIPVNDNFAMRFAGIYAGADPYIENQFPGSQLPDEEKVAVRWSTTYNKDDLTVYTTVEYEDRELPGTVYRAIEEGDIWDAFDAGLGPVTLRGDEHAIDSDLSAGAFDSSQVLNLGMTIKYDLGFADLTSNTGFKDHDYYYSEDYDGTPLRINDYTQDQTGDYFQQELRLSSNSEGPLSWYVGASYYKENIDTNFGFISDEDNMCQYYGNYYYPGNNFTGCTDLYAYYGSSFSPSPDGTLTETNRVNGEYSGWATYVNMEYAVNDQFDLELGIRYTSDTKKFSNEFPTPESWLGAYWAYGFSTAEALTDEQSWTDTTFRGLARWKPEDDTMFYASYTQGYKSGGFGSFALTPNAAGDVAAGLTEITMDDGFLPGTFEPEVVDSYEFGYKGSLFDGNTKLDLTAFYYEYQDLQVVVFENGASQVKNVGEAESTGIEGSVNTKLSENLNLYFAVGILDSEATKLQDICSLEDPDGCEGSSLFWAPEFSGSIVLDGNFPLDSGASITASMEMFWESERGGGWENLNSTELSAFQEVNARIGYQSATNWYIQAYVENLTDEVTWAGMNNNGGIIPSHLWGQNRSRTFGVRMGMTWE